MKQYHSLYVSPSLLAQKEKIIQNIERDKWQINKYVIVLNPEGKNQLEFYSTSMLLQKVFSTEDLFVIGIADGYDGALKLVEQITEEVYTATQETDIRGYLLEKQREYETGNV